MNEDQQEIVTAQRNLDFYPDNCEAFWDSPDGQETIAVAKKHGLRTSVEDEVRRDLYQEAMEEAYQDNFSIDDLDPDNEECMS